MKTIFPVLLCCCGFCVSIFAQNTERFEFNLKINYHYGNEDSLPNSHYQLKEKTLIRRLGRHEHIPSKAEHRSDTLVLNERQMEDLKTYCKEHWNEEHYHGLCRALSPVYAHIELWQDEKFVEENYAPCRINVLHPSFGGFQRMLDRFFDSR